MQSSKGPESLDLGRTVSRSRSTSMSSDSQLPRLHLLVPPAVNPAPCFIASSAAAQIVTADQEFNAADFVDDEEDNASPASALVTPEALSALNGFLDHLLYNILASSKSTQLACIRPAVAEVLKPRLAKEVVSAADEELSEYMGGPEDEQFGGQTPSAEFDLIRSWKLTRLRCMVYTRLGDMEEDDEEEYIEQDGLGEGEDGPQRFSSHIGYITPAAAIFLAHIIEYLGEKALVIAGETARSRLSSKVDDELAESGAERSTMDRLVVEDLDMEKLALNPTLGRLWRTWRKRTRSPNLSRATSRESIRRRGTIGHLPVRGQRGSVAVDEFLPARSQPSPRPEPPADVDPASVAIPVNEHDVQEIEVPGFASDTDGGEVIQTMEAVVAHKVRPRSLMVLTLPSPRSPTFNGNSPISPRPQSAKTHRHARSRSLPGSSAALPPQETPKVEQTNDQTADHPSPTSSEERRQLETMYEHDEDDESTADKKPVIVDSTEPEQVLSPSVESPTKKSETDSFPEESNGQDTAATSSVSGASAEVVTSRANSTRASSLSDRNQPDSEAEIIEGQGMAEKPKLASVQRPRKSSRGPSRKNDRSTAAVSSEQMVQSVAEDPPQTQGGDSTPAQPAVSTEASNTSDTDLTSPDPVTPQPRFSTDNSSEEKSPRPLSSAESAYSESSRVRQRPSPLPLRRGSTHQQTPYGRSSPAASTTSSGTERAAVQRLSGRPTTSAASSSYSKPRRSESFSSYRDKRPVTAGSTTSQVSTKIKGLIVRQGDSSSLQLRSSSETSRASSHDEKADLDDLIRSEETIHFTLTPRNMREIEEPDSPRWRNQQSNTADLADFLKSTAPPASPRPGTSGMAKADFPSITKTKSSDLPKHKPIQPSNMSLPPARPSAGHSRDTKPSIGSTREFANSVKNGPPSPSTMKSRIRRFSDAADFSKKFTRPPSSLSNTARSSHAAPSAPRLQARPAVAPKGDQSSDLIDFIREGPPTAGARRIPRTVAPFRDTMDSDELQSLGPSYAENQAPSIISTQDDSYATKSITSVGSHTGLLDSSNRVPAPTSAPRPAPVVAPEPVTVSDDPRPARKQRRVPDPYAIDYDDDEDLEELLEGPKPPKREEESLMDFLMNAAPPPATSGPPQPFVNASAAKAPSSGTSSMKARLLRNGPSTKTSRTSLRQPPAPSNPPVVSANYTTKIGMERNAAARSNSYNMPTVSQRQTETSSLADFLRSTGPPEPPVVRTPPPSAGGKSKESSSGFSRLFVRRKKVET
ncbi:uncharacterized protein KD926_008921 [Aspergillus affinis]|uniref:uncharacterized protein n=1 Tax=Aspergillus affinis TaxID=1070780 RepID=UPI0022FDCD81|nr:uncharacterized protein KD926_008921 [Aspergillus affinis]KAI9039935.1 hypothetical protein KD926_008921 [Aspergillus affinis]